MVTPSSSPKLIHLIWNIQVRYTHVLPQDNLGGIGHFKSIEDLLDLLAPGGRGFLNPGLTLITCDAPMKHLKHPSNPCIENQKIKTVYQKVGCSTSPPLRWATRQVFFLQPNNALISTKYFFQLMSDSTKSLRLGRLHTVRRNCSNIFKHNGEELKSLWRNGSFSKQLQQFTKLKALNCSIHEATKSTQMSIPL